jgi:hypothetical protein
VQLRAQVDDVILKDELLLPAVARSARREILVARKRRPHADDWRPQADEWLLKDDDFWPQADRGGPLDDWWPQTDELRKEADEWWLNQDKNGPNTPIWIDPRPGMFPPPPTKPDEKPNENGKPNKPGDFKDDNEPGTNGENNAAPGQLNEKSDRTTHEIPKEKENETPLWVDPWPVDRTTPNSPTGNGANMGPDSEDGSGDVPESRLNGDNGSPDHENEVNKGPDPTDGDGDNKGPDPANGNEDNTGLDTPTEKPDGGHSDLGDFGKLFYKRIIVNQYFARHGPFKMLVGFVPPAVAYILSAMS